MFFFLSLILWIQGFILRWPWFFEQEIAISFLPYMIVFNSITILLLFSISLYHYKKRYIIIWLLFILPTVLSIQIIQETISYKPYTIQDTQESLSFFFANIYYQNNKIDDILKTITNQDPDIIMLVEYAKIHDEKITPQLKKTYPYVSRYIGNTWYDGDIIFSKYPLQKINHTTIPGSFSHVTIAYKTKQLDIALLHTSAPISRYFFEMRTKQLNELQDILVHHYTQHSQENIILAWDFNITPWSPYYTTQLKQPFQSIGLSNISNNIYLTQYKNYIPYTRCLKQFPIACAQIDHIWSNNMNMKLTQVIVDWSDHTGFFGTIYLQ